VTSNWKIKFSEVAKKNIENLDKETARRIIKFLLDRLSTLENPRSIGEALKGSKLGDFWRYRVGDYRIIASIQDLEFSVLVVKIGHRKEIYR
jgi:mRNA interferase RelE/StbE